MFLNASQARALCFTHLNNYLFAESKMCFIVFLALGLSAT